ncbi:MAG TPA: hypothetical protein VKZ18_25440 [Polyangia bacterium]|nr:hypothetical protein [Polyangia bacterium]
MKRPFPPRWIVDWARGLLREIVASDPELGKGLARFGTWQSLAAVVGTDWLPLPRRASPGVARVVRQRLRALAAQPRDAVPPDAGQPVQLRGTCAPLPGGAPQLWSTTIVEDGDGMWVADEGQDFVLRGAGGEATLVLARGGRLVNAPRLDAGDEVIVFGLADRAPDRVGLAGTPGGRGGFVPALRSDSSRPLLLCLIRRYDQREDAPQD